MLWVMVFALVAAVFAVAFGVAGAARLVMAPHRTGLSRKLRVALVVSAAVAAVAAVVAADRLGWGWAIAPVGLWLVMLAVLRNTAPARESDAEHRRRLEEEFGSDGACRLAHARACVDAIRSTRAASDGWLGEQADLDFTDDLEMIAANLRRARTLQRVIDESSALPQAGAEDMRLQHDAERAVARLGDEVTARIQALGDCAIAAQQLDGMLAAERERARLAERRDDVRSRLSSLLYGAEVTPAAPPSQAAEAISARIAAFRELKNAIDNQRRGNPGPAAI